MRVSLRLKTAGALRLRERPRPLRLGERPRPLARRARRRPNARSVLTALRKVKDLSYTTIATGHGPMLRLNLDELVQRRALRGRADREAAVL
jgi:hypothetical protein